MDAAEAVFVADSRAVSAQLRHLRAYMIHPVAIVAVSMFHIVCGFLGPDLAMQWLGAHSVPACTAADRALADEAIRLAQPGALTDVPGWTGEVAEAWQTRIGALAAYRDQLPADTDIDTVAESLLHMHHNRAIGIDPDSERSCRRLAHQAARAWQGRRAGVDR
jgi:thiopeptide-type bacteriocin biosynthesis protein